MEILDKKNYTLFINSNDKISGSNNNATYQVNWDDFLPRNYNCFKLTYLFQSSGGNYIDFTSNSNSAFTATISSTTLTIVAIQSGIIFVGQTITGTGVTSCVITNFLTGTQSTAGATYTISVSQTVATTTAMVGTGVNNGVPITYNSAKIVLQGLGGRSYSFDTSSKSQSYSLGIVQRDLQLTGTSTSASNTMSAFYLQNPSKTISRPNQNLMNIQIYNISYTTPTLFTTTDAYGNTATYAGGTTANNKALNSAINDMTPYQMVLEFYTIEESILKDIKSQNI